MIEVREAGPKGRGLFATGDIMAGEIAVIDRHVELVPALAGAERWLFDWDRDSSALAFGMSPLVNHSTVPNAFLLQGLDTRGRPFIALVARCPIATGGEITIRYGGGVARCDLPSDIEDEAKALREIAAAAETKAHVEDAAEGIARRDLVIVQALDVNDRKLIEDTFALSDLETAKIDGDRRDPDVRSTTVGWIERANPGEMAGVMARFDAAAAEVAAGLRLGPPRPLEDLQVGRYRVGDFYADHQDHGVTATARRLSVTALVSDFSDFAGGAFIHEGREIALRPGEAIGFHSRALHGVRPVTSGVRWSLTGWYA